MGTKCYWGQGSQKQFYNKSNDKCQKISDVTFHRSLKQSHLVIQERQFQAGKH